MMAKNKPIKPQRVEDAESEVKTISMDEFDRIVEEKLNERLNEIKNDPGDEIIRKLGLDKAIQKDRKDLVDKFDAVDVYQILDDTAKYIDLLRASAQWQQQLSIIQREQINAVRVFVSQLLDEDPQPHRPLNLGDLIREKTTIPVDPITKRGNKGKRFRLMREHLVRSGLASGNPGEVFSPEARRALSSALSEED